MQINRRGPDSWPCRVTRSGCLSGMCFWSDDSFEHTLYLTNDVSNTWWDVFARERHTCTLTAQRSSSFPRQSIFPVTALNEDHCYISASTERKNPERWNKCRRCTFCLGSVFLIRCCHNAVLVRFRHKIHQIIIILLYPDPAARINVSFLHFCKSWTCWNLICLSCCNALKKTMFWL